jgi:ferrous iron transport protein A
VITLAELALRRSARVVAVRGVGEVSGRLLEMGLTPGVEVRVLGVAPFGDPIELEVRHYRLSLRKAEAALIEVEPEPV